MPRQRKRIILVGLGPYARRFYYPHMVQLASKGELEIAAVIDLEAQRDVLADYFAARSEPAPELVLLSGASPSPGDPSWARLDRLAEGSWGCVVATEPRSHRQYALWALKRGLRVLLEKPITARDLAGEDSDPSVLVSDFDEISALASERRLPVIVQTQRRAHDAYMQMHEWARELINEFGVPLTHISLSHADGSWNHPWEFEERENHPHRFGYGKLLHSGYHMIDTACWFSELNALSDSAPDSLWLSTTSVSPYDVQAQVTAAAYGRLFGPHADGRVRRAELLADEPRWGETDVIITTQTRAGSRAVSTGVITLLQTSFTRRSTLTLPVDTYKGNGRVRHESVSMQFGPLGAIHAQSLQDGDAGEGDGEFVVRYFRNSALAGGAASREERFAQAGSESLNQRARTLIFDDFLNERSERSGIQRHRTSVRVLAEAVASVRSRHTEPDVHAGNHRVLLL